MIKLLSQFILTLWGWKINGVFPQNSKKFIIIVAPHRKGFLDVLLGWCVRNIHPLPGSHFLAKIEIMRVPVVGAVLHYLGGIAVDRHGTHGERPQGDAGKGFYVKALAQQIRDAKEFTLGIAVEGTRKPGVPWKTGFYKISIQAQIPLVCVGFDYRRKTVEIGPIKHMTGKWELDRERIRDWYHTYVPGYKPNIPEVL